jgi:hypothetical protein
MKLQIEDLMDWLPVLFPGHHFILLLDQSSGHTKKREDGLDVANMNIGFGGKKPKMHASKISEGCLGPLDNIFRDENKEQQLVFASVETITETDGPFFMLDATEQERRQEDSLKPAEVELQKTGKKLRTELQAEGVDNQPLPSRLDRLRSLATDHGIGLTKMVSNLEEGNKTIPELRRDIKENGGH